MPTSPSASVAPGGAAAAADDDDDVDMMDQDGADDSNHDEQNMEEAGDEGNQDPTPAAAPPKRKVNRRPKLTADRLLDDEHGLKCIMQDFEKSITFTGDTIRDLDTVILNYGAWAGRLYPYGMPLADFARTCETELYPEIKRRRIYDFRLDYVRRKGRFGPLEGGEGGGSASNSTTDAGPSNANEVGEAVDGGVGGGDDDDDDDASGGGGGGGVDNNSPPQPVKLTPEEMRLRMEANRLKALERRRLKEQQQQQQQQQQHEEEQEHPQPRDGEQQQGGEHEHHHHHHHKSA
ncbi:hypothetical protein FOZ61_003565 [Perkinsus olseni]|uniref:Chromosome segregation in meiosis protein 3 domain-containing protein n=1 Tax=Perkinsus olseni TaxID=32597 RepID=A0A7J6MDG2_PEROL|nr:hypothetical protein FOZ61_003565 [Perkinsus olseni]